MPVPPPPFEPPFGGRAPMPQPVLVQVAPRRGGVGQAILFLLTLGVIGAAFLAGLVTGGVAMLASPTRPIVLEMLERQGSSSRIAILDVEGAIDETLARNFARAVDHVLADSSINAVVVRVESPGGAVGPSDRIRRDLGRLSDSGRPVIASYGSMAASGGVYVSCGADHIVSEPTTVTGSVGVIAGLMTFEGLLDTVGISPVTLVAAESPRKDDANDIFRAWTDEDRAVVQRLLDSAHALFVAHVTSGRAGKAPDDKVLRSVLDGRILTAEEALAAGMVDAIGYLDDAIIEAEQRAHLPAGSATVVRVFRPRPFLGTDFLGAQGTLRTALETEVLPRDGAGLRDLLDGLGELRLEYRLRLP